MATSPLPITLDDIAAARPIVAKHLPKTPLVRTVGLSALVGCDYFAKCESLQPVGAFKVRGGVNLVGSLSDDEKRAGVVTASTGNHGQSIAFASRLFGVRAIVYSPAENVNPAKMQAMKDLGAEVRLFGKDFDEARGEVERIAVREGMRYIHSANEPKLIAGVGTMGLEIFEDLPNLDVILVPVGAGSGACGIGIVAKAWKPSVRVIGVQSERSPALFHAWKNRNLEPWPTSKTVHEGLATRVPFELTTSILWDVLDDFVLVSDDAIDEAVLHLARLGKLIAEGAGAATLAAVLQMKDKLKGKTVVGVLSGGNIAPARLARLFEKLWE